VRRICFSAPPHGAATLGLLAAAPSPHAYQQWDTTQQRLKVQGKQIFDAEMAREKAGDCPASQTTSDFNDCFGKQLTRADESLRSYEASIQSLMAPPPGPPDPSDPELPQPRTPEQDRAEFDQVEQSWKQYRDLACTAALHQFDGGSGGPSFEMECRLKLTRNHMRELAMIYGESFL
jgi:uncharacterized protein YecT (DUF1311 family)